MSVSRDLLGMPTPSRPASSDYFNDVVYTPGRTPYPQYTRPVAIAKTWGAKSEKDVQLVPGSIGLLPDEAYERTLGWWRAAIRKRLLRSYIWESNMIAAMQVRNILFSTQRICSEH
jgi:dihydrosphingosine 1-phosphate phosphatase